MFPGKRNRGRCVVYINANQIAGHIIIKNYSFTNLSTFTARILRQIDIKRVRVLVYFILMMRGPNRLLLARLFFG